MRQLFFILYISFLVTVPAGAQQKNATVLNSEFDKLLAAQFKPNEPGAAAIVTKNGQVIYKKGFGMSNLELDVPMKEDGVFKIGSITKQFTAIAILQLMEKGKLKLDDEITKYIPDYPTQGSKITIEHLLTHTSGIRDFTSIPDTLRRVTVDYTPTEMINYFKNEPMRFAPGSKYEYSNSGYFLLGYIIEKITGKSYAHYIEENFFKPLGMSTSLYANSTKLVKNRVAGYRAGEKGFENAPYESMSHPYAAGAILSTVEELFKWQQALFSYKLVKKETLEKALTRYKLIDGKEIDYGYGWRLGYIQGSESNWHGGRVYGFITMSMYLPKEDVFVAVLSNCECNAPVDVTAKLAALAIGKPYQYKAIQVNAADLQKYIGVYENGKGQQKILTVSENKLFIQTGRSPKTVIKAHQKDKFYTEEDVFTSFEFIRDKKGTIEKLITGNRTSNEVWNKTNKAMPSPDGIKLDEKILENYVGVYEMNPEFSFTITKEGSKLFLQAVGQERLEIFAETETKFFVKVNDAQFEFIRDASGKVIKALMSQGGRNAEAKKIK